MDWIIENVLPMVAALLPYGTFFSMIAYYGFRAWKNKTAHFPEEVKNLKIEFKDFGQQVKKEMRKEFNIRLEKFEKENQEQLKTILAFKDETKLLNDRIVDLTENVGILLEVVAVLVSKDKEFVQEGKAKNVVNLIDDFKAKRVMELTKDEEMLKKLLAIPKEKLEEMLEVFINEENETEKL